MSLAQNISPMITGVLEGYKTKFFSGSKQEAALIDMLYDLEFKLRDKTDEQLADFMKDEWGACVSAITALLNPTNGESFGDQQLKTDVEALIENVARAASPRKPRSVSFGDPTIHELPLIENDSAPTSPAKQDWQVETAKLIKEVMAKHEHKADAEETPIIKKPVAAVIATLSKAEKIFDTDDLKIEQVHGSLPTFIASLRALIYPRDGSVFPDPELKLHTKVLIDKFKSLTPPQTGMYFSKKSGAHSYTQGQIPSSQRELMEAMKAADEPCCWTPSKCCIS